MFGSGLTPRRGRRDLDTVAQRLWALPCCVAPSLVADV